MENIFKNVKFGDLFVSADGKKYAFCSFTTNGNETLARLYREKWGVIIFYLDGHVHSGCEFGNGIDFTIVGKWQEPIDEEKLGEILDEGEKMEKKLNFNKNYNGKLWLNYFTTIRSLGTIKEKDLKDGDYVQIQKDHLTLFQAQIVSIEEIDLDNLTESQRTLLALDVGCHWTQAVGSLKQIYKSNKVAVITLVK